MTISIPLSVELVSSDVIDVTQTFNPDEHLTSYPSGIQYQYNNNIYQNTGDTIQVKDYNAVDEAGYTDGQILYKDATNTAHYFVSGDFPKQPSTYTEAQNTGFSAETWTTRYSKLDSLPVGFTDNEVGTNTAPKPTKIAWKSDGLKCIGLYFGNTIATFTCSTAWDIETRTMVADSDRTLAWQDFDGTWLDIAVKGDGTKIIIMTAWNGTGSYTNAIGSYSLGTAWNTAGTVTFTGHSTLSESTQYKLGGFQVSNASETELTMFWHGMYGAGLEFVNKVTIPTTWDCDGLTQGTDISLPILKHGSSYIRDVSLYASGTKAVFVCGYSSGYAVYLFTVPIAYDLTSITTADLLGVKFFDSVVLSIHLASDFKSFWAWQDNSYKKYSFNTAWDIGKSIHSSNLYDVTEIDHAHTSCDTLLTTPTLFRWRMAWDGSKYVAGGYTYSITSGSTLGSATSDGAVYATLDNDTIESDAIAPINNYCGSLIKTIIWDGTDIWGRTHLNRYAETETLDYHAYYPVVSPTDIPQFALIGSNNIHRPLDGKNYSIASSTGLTMSYSVKCIDGFFDTLALGRVKADSVTATFKLEDGTTITEVTRAIDRKIDTLDNIDGAYANIILYAEQVMPVNSIVDITLTASTGTLELGTIMLGQSLDAGFHRLSLKHSYKDFSTATYDPFGNLDYVEKQRIATYNGNVDIIITDYDRIVRLFTYLGKKLVIVNGSKNKTNAPDSQTVFASTQLIGRFMSFSCRTIENKNDIDPIATYDFTLEELA